MGRFKSDKAPTQPVQFPTTPTGSPLPQQQMQMGGMPQQQGGFPQQQMGQYNPQDWPTSFPKPMIGFDRDGVVVE